MGHGTEAVILETLALVLPKCTELSEYDLTGEHEVGFAVVVGGLDEEVVFLVDVVKVEDFLVEDELVVVDFLVLVLDVLEVEVVLVDEDVFVEEEVLEEEVEVEDLDDDEDEVEPVSGTPPGPATICKMFSALTLKIAGASETWLLSRS